MEEFALQVNETDTLKGRKWEVENPIANVVIFQGMEEYGLRYDHFAKFLNSHGVNAYSLDTYGQGLNVKEDLSNRSFWPKNGFVKMVDAYHTMVNEAKKNGAKTYIFSHSMGSFMGQKYIQRYPDSVEKIVLCGTGSKKPGMGVAKLAAKLLSLGKRRNKKAGIANTLMFGGFSKSMKNPKTDYDWLSFNEENVRKYVDDPLCGFGPTNGFCYELVVGMYELYTKKGLNNISKDQKIFLIAGESDVVTDFTKCTQKMFDLYNSLGIKDVTKKIYPESRHELIFEACRDEVYQDVLDFFLK
ncbi:MAG: lysophospholipase [Bacilli bacterium]|nr:lysophospholipase [Bacilli bacterium]